MLLHLETMMCFFFSRDSFVVLAYALDQCPTGRPVHDAFVGPRLSEGDSCPRFVHLSNWATQSSCSFGRKTSSEHKASTTMTAGMLFLGSQFFFFFYKFVRIWQFLLRSVTDTFRWYRKHVEVLLLVLLSRLGTNEISKRGISVNCTCRFIWSAGSSPNNSSD